MNETGFQLALRHVERERLTIDVLAARCGLHPALLERFVEYGLLEPLARAGTEMWFDLASITRLRLIERLRHDLGANLAGVAVILDLLDRMALLQGEVERLRREF